MTDANKDLSMVLPPEVRATRPGASTTASGAVLGPDEKYFHPAPAPTPREVATVKRGEAIAHVRALEEKVERQDAEIARLYAGLRNAENQRDLLDEDRRKWRADADAYKTHLLELSAAMSAVGVLMQRAQDTHQRILNLIARETTEVVDPLTGPPETASGVRYDPKLDHLIAGDDAARTKLDEIAMNTIANALGNAANGKS